jgi:hypothetical protein
MTVISTTKQIISTDSIAVVRNPPTTNNMGASINLITYLIQDQRENERHETSQRDRSYQSRYFIGCEFHRIISISNRRGGYTKLRVVVNGPLRSDRARPKGASEEASNSPVGRGGTLATLDVFDFKGFARV